MQIFRFVSFKREPVWMLQKLEGLSILFGNNNETETAYVNTILLINFYPKLIGNNNFV